MIRPMLTLYRRHKQSCPHKSPRYLKCRCRLWVHGKLDGRSIRRSMDMTNYEDAQRKVREWESGVKEPVHIAVRDGVAQFIADIDARKLAKATIKKYRHTLEKILKPFCE